MPTTRLILHTAAFITIAPGAILLLVPAIIIALAGATLAPTPVAATAAAVLAAGLALFLWCVADFIARGRGTPDPNRPPERLVVAGPFRFVRNPMYVALLVILLGETILFLQPWLLAWAAVVFLAFHLRVLIYEEPTLARTFGDDWRAYRARTPRWLPTPRRP